MTAEEMATKPCCKDHDDRHGAPVMPMHNDAVASSMPCHNAPASDAPEAPCSDTPDWLALRAACCANVEAPTAPAPERIQPLQAGLLALAATVLTLPPEPPPSPPRPTGDLPPPAPVALHVLYNSFLT